MRFQDYTCLPFIIASQNLFMHAPQVSGTFKKEEPALGYYLPLYDATSTNLKWHNGGLYLYRDSNGVWNVGPEPDENKDQTLVAKAATHSPFTAIWQVYDGTRFIEDSSVVVEEVDPELGNDDYHNSYA